MRYVAVCLICCTASVTVVLLICGTSLINCSKEIEELEKQQKDVKDNDSAKKISQQLAVAQIKWKLADSKRVREAVSY